jgi:hypothetical protein
MAITRREFLKAAAAGTVLTGIGLPSIAFGAKKTVKIGFARSGPNGSMPLAALK